MLETLIVSLLLFDVSVPLIFTINDLFLVSLFVKFLRYYNFHFLDIFSFFVIGLVGVMVFFLNCFI